VQPSTVITLFIGHDNVGHICRSSTRSQHGGEDQHRAEKQQRSERRRPKNSTGKTDKAKHTEKANDAYFISNWPKDPSACQGLCRKADLQLKFRAKQVGQTDTYHSTFDTIRETAKKGCSKCVILHTCFAAHVHSSGQKDKDHDGDARAMMRYIHCIPAGILCFGQVADFFGALMITSSGNGQIVFPFGKSPKPPWDYISPSRTTAGFGARRHEYGAILNSWLDDCHADHEECCSSMPDPPPPPLPRRVLDVTTVYSESEGGGGGGGGDDIRLHISSPEEEARFVALSHCWGSGSASLIRTTTKNMQQRVQGIPFATLPKSFQDAVSVTRSIGVQYLWIDSLCIIQDSIADWERESSQMARIYGDAYLVIAASQATDSTCGFIDRIPWYSESSSSSLDLLDWSESPLLKENSQEVGQIYNAANSTTSRILLRKMPRDEDYQRGYYRSARHSKILQEAPLSKRAWTFQENLLARRIVHFTPHEMLWECIEGLKCECMEMDAISPQLSPQEQQTAIVRKARYDTTVPSEYQGDTKSLWRFWLVEYSGRRLTVESDRFPALSGLAKQWQARRRARQQRGEGGGGGVGGYLAGFWRNDLLPSILWLVEGGLCQRSAHYRAPTWSPFSLDYTDDNFWRKGRAEGVEFSYHDKFVYYDDGAYKWYATVVDAQCFPAGSDETGAVKGGFVILRGQVQHCRNQTPFSEEELEIFTMNPDAYSKYPVKEGGVEVKVHWDIFVDPQKVPVLTLMFLIEFQYQVVGVGCDATRWEDRTKGLVLIPSENVPGAFERVGCFEQQSHCPIRELPTSEETVKIV